MDHSFKFLSSAIERTTMKLPHVVFIDDGINRTPFGVDLVYDLEVIDDKDHTIVTRFGSDQDNINHSTTCYGIVKKYCPDFICSSIKVLNDYNWKGSIERLLTALEWCLDKDIDIINLSLGTTSNFDAKKLLPIINKLAQNKLIIAAASNKNIATYPASFTSVVGVITTTDKKNISIFTNSFEGFTVKAPSEHVLITNAGHTFTTEHSNSCAAPYITALACNSWLQGENIGYNQFISILQKESGIDLQNTIYERIDWVQKAILVTDAGGNFVPESFELAGSFTPDNKHNSYYQAALENKTIDTVFFTENAKHRKQRIEKMIFDALKMDKNIVVAEGFPPYTLAYSPSKKWSCKIEPTFYNPVANKIDIPLVAIFDDSMERLIQACQFFFNNFELNGYYAPICSNCPASVFINAFYLPEDIVRIDSYLSQVQRAYSADLLVCGILTDKNTFHSYLKYFESLETDIAIFLTPESGLEYIGENSIHLEGSNITIKNDLRVETFSCTEKYNEIIFEKAYNILIS